MTQEQLHLAVIGGSGLYGMPGLTEISEHDIDTPFGKPSAPIVMGTLEGSRVAFLARHGAGHRYSPTEVNYRANIYALKALGATHVLSVTACGSLREDYAPGHIVVPDQLIDFTRNRKRTFFEGGLVAHVGVADPFCPDFSSLLYQACQESGATAHNGGSFITIEGPRFSTRGESNIFRSWGISIIGMTASPEAFLAREAELCYAAMAHVTDYDVWHISEEPVTAEMVFQTVSGNLEIAQNAVRVLAGQFNRPRTCDCADALKSALTTGRSAMNPETRQRLALLVDKYLG